LWVCWVEHKASELQHRLCRSRFSGEPSTVIVANEALHRIVSAVEPLA
jgi:hypothetical protein